MMAALTIACALGALGAAATLAMTLINLRALRRTAPDSLEVDVPVSVCIPARNEAANIEHCLRHVLASDHAGLEALVYDDDSEDDTAAIVTHMAQQDERVRLVPGEPLPGGWNGKQHACHRLSRAARAEWLLFIDADVRLEAGAIRRALRFARSARADLVSTFPRQITATMGEALQVPMMFFLLLSYLPLGRMRRTRDPATSAGCGQFLLVRAEAYRAAGGHAALRSSMHDGVKLPRNLRRAGFRTDLFDGTDLASVRMYRGFADTWRGFAKNAYEGLGSVAALALLTVFHLLAHVAPWLLLPWLVVEASWLAAGLCAVAVGCAMIQRWLLSKRFGHTRILAMLHPVTVALMIGVQWYSFVLHVRGARQWRGRAAGAAVAPVERVVLVDELDREIGQAEKLEAHRDGGRLHRAFSVFLFDGHGRTLLQRRAEGKYHFGGLWTNTCCGHPRPGETPLAGATRRLREEMGIEAPLSPIGRFLYRAADERSGLVEHELDHVFTGRFDGDPAPDPSEASGWRWVTLAELDAELRARPDRFTPWFALALAEARSFLDAAQAEAAGAR
ncbi:MAG: isopentenyl-diphosphate Delta-isomerase [Phycisphaerales bacterium JB039]